MTKLATSADRGKFHIECVNKAVAEGKKTAEAAEEMIELYRSWRDEDIKREADPEWAKDNMEYDLRSCDWMVAKVRAREEYAQNLYAAMCNRDFQKNDVWPLLSDKTWSCSWRYAGGIVAHMAGEGDYIDWYCSGISGRLDDDDRAKMTPEAIARYEWMAKHFVGEGHVTDEIREDLLKLGWIVLDDGLEE
jgi:hypothetical protein